jgi:hypothetical protein
VEWKRKKKKSKKQAQEQAKKIEFYRLSVDKVEGRRGKNKDVCDTTN